MSDHHDAEQEPDQETPEPDERPRRGGAIPENVERAVTGPPEKRG